MSLTLVAVEHAHPAPAGLIHVTAIKIKTQQRFLERTVHTALAMRLKRQRLHATKAPT